MFRCITDQSILERWIFAPGLDLFMPIKNLTRAHPSPDYGVYPPITHSYCFFASLLSRAQVASDGMVCQLTANLCTGATNPVRHLAWICYACLEAVAYRAIMSNCS